MSRPASRGSISASPILPQFNNFVRRSSRALVQYPSSIRSSSRASRNSSRGRRNSLSDEYKRRSVSADRARTFDQMLSQSGGHVRPTKVRRWDGNCRTTTNWDFLRKDPELWFSNGDTYVHFYSEGQSRRGPSLRLCLADIEANNCRPLLEEYCSEPVPDTPPKRSSRNLENDYFTARETPVKYELFIPAPNVLSREDSMNFHLTTRNFFAWMFEKPLVGSRLGETMINLRRRMDDWRPDPEENMDDFLQYIDAQGYTDFRDCPDHALAVMQWAESVQNAELWTDAFVHCVGMNEQLVSSNEFSAIPRSTIALITRSNLEMAVRIDRASVALASFLEDDDVLYNQIQLSDATLKHMQRFRSFLHSFYVQRHGYWPPHIIQASSGKVRPLPKHTFLTMYADFRNLYEFLVDPQADLDNLSEAARSLLGVLKLVDKQRKFDPLPHTLPRLPEADFEAGEQRRPSFFSIFGNRKARQAKRTIIATSLTSATNVSDMKVVSSAMVREYALFEREFTLKENDRISATEARMARWTLIYALLQTIISVTNAPSEVRDIEGVDYPLCCQTGGTPPWKFSKPSSTSIATLSTLTAKASEKSAATKSTTPSLLAPPSQELITPMSDYAISAQPSPLDLELVAKRRKSESIKSPATASSFPRSSALKSAVSQTSGTTTPSKTPDSLTPSTSRSAKRSRIPVPVSHSQASSSIPPTPSYTSSTPPPSASSPLNNTHTINSRSTALSSHPTPTKTTSTTTTTTTTIQAPKPVKPMSDTLLRPYTDSSAPTTPLTELPSTLPPPPSTGTGTHNEDTDDCSTSVAGSAPTLISSGGPDSDLETTASPTRAGSERTGAPTPNPPPSPSFYHSTISIAASSSDNIHTYSRGNSQVRGPSIHRQQPSDLDDNDGDFEPVPIGRKRHSNSHVFAGGKNSTNNTASKNMNKITAITNAITNSNEKAVSAPASAPRQKRKHHPQHSIGSTTPSFGPAQSYAPAPTPYGNATSTFSHPSTSSYTPSHGVGNRDAIFGSQRASMKTSSSSTPTSTSAYVSATATPYASAGESDTDTSASASESRGRRRSKSRSARNGNGDGGGGGGGGGFGLRGWSKSRNRSQNSLAYNGNGNDYAGEGMSEDERSGRDSREGREGRGIKGLIRKSFESLRSSSRGRRDDVGSGGYGASYGVPHNASANAGVGAGAGYGYSSGGGGGGGYSDVSTTMAVVRGGGGGELGNLTSVYTGPETGGFGGASGGGGGSGDMDEGRRRRRGSSRHVRDRSSELAQMFRNELRWKEGPGWDWESEGILRGEA